MNNCLNNVYFAAVGGLGPSSMATISLNHFLFASFSKNCSKTSFVIFSSALLSNCFFITACSDFNVIPGLSFWLGSLYVSKSELMSFPMLDWLFPQDFDSTND